MAENSDCGSACSLQSLSHAHQVSDESELQLTLKQSLTQCSAREGQLKKKSNDSSSSTLSDSIKNSHLDYKSGAIYEGKVKDNLKFGQGLFLWPNGDKYMGDFRSNCRHGFGI